MALEGRRTSCRRPRGERTARALKARAARQVSAQQIHQQIVVAALLTIQA